MIRPEIRLAVFDCDGTLVDSQHTICAAMETCFVEMGLPAPEPARTRRVVGLSLVEAMREMAPDAHADLHVEMAERYKLAFQAMRRAGPVHEPLFDGIAGLIDAFDEAGWLMGVATGKSDRGLDLCLGAHGLTGRFVTLQTADRHPSKPHPSMLHQAMNDAGADAAATIMIGDTSYDMAMARAAGVTAIGVAWGYHEAAELTAAGADIVVGTPDEIFAFAKELA